MDEEKTEDTAEETTEQQADQQGQETVLAYVFLPISTDRLVTILGAFGGQAELRSERLCKRPAIGIYSLVAAVE